MVSDVLISQIHLSRLFNILFAERDWLGRQGVQTMFCILTDIGVRAGVFSNKPRIEFLVNLGTLIIVFQAEVFAIKMGVRDLMNLLLVNEHITIISDS